MGESWKRIREIFERALDRTAGRRAEFLDEACAGDEGVRRRVEELLAAHERAEGFLARPAALPTEVAPEAGAAGPAPERAEVGTVLDGKYRLDGLLGAGGMGAVYRAWHLQLERAVALKVIRGELLGSRATAERFRREAVAMAQLRHPHIVAVYDYGVSEDVGAYIVMELLEGRSLREELAERRRLGVPEALRLIGQACEAVGAAHRAGIVHRDIKPENIFLEQRGGAPTVKVLDFGLARLEAALNPRRELPSLEGAVFGTPAYMSPERCLGQKADARSDVYALGCVLYEMLAGRPPFTGAASASLVYQHVHDAPRRPSELVSEIAPWLDDALLCALSKRPDERPATADALGRALGAPGGRDAAETGPRAAVTGGGGRATAVEGGGAGRAAARTPNNLPEPMTRFIGRERQIGEVRGWLSRARLVTLTGPGGIGKTRTALEVARRVLGEYRDGVWLAELAALSDPALVPGAVAAAVGVHEQGGSPVAETLAAWLRDRRALVVLDNCEHLVPACAALARELLETCPGLRVLATSREALGLAGEAVWPVPPLSLPEPDGPDGAIASEAARLFADRAALRKPSFEATAASALAEICRRLEGIPLGIELAAARVAVLSVEEILERVDDRFRLLADAGRRGAPRQQALRATIDWSYELLTGEERALLRRLSVFSGGWTLDAAEAVAPGAAPSGGEDVAREDVLDVLSRLLDKSLVTAHERDGATRYAMLEMIREYGLELLSRHSEAEPVRRRHAAYFLELAEAAERRIRGGQPAAWVARLEEEHDNVRAALGWALEHDAELALRLAAATNQFRALHGHLAEARRSMEAALARAGASPARLRVTALLGAGFVAGLQGDLGAARGFYERGLPLAREAGDAAQTATLTYGLGTVADMEGDLGAARAYFEESLASSRAGGNRALAAESLNGLGEVARHEGDWEAAKGYYEQALAVARAHRNEHAESVLLCNLGAVECERGDLAAARACYAGALAAARAVGSKEFVGLCLDGLGALAVREGAPERAARLAGAAEALLEEVGATRGPADRALRERYLAEARRRLGEAGLEAALAEGRAASPEAAADDALSA